MSDLSAYRERFAAVREYENHIANRRNMILQSDAVYREYADAALAALAGALGEAEATTRLAQSARDQAQQDVLHAAAELAELAELTKRVETCCQHSIAATIARKQAEAERDLAIAHDRQPYPTAYAYETLCKAFDYWRGRAEQAEADHNAVAKAYDERYAQLTAAWAELAAYRSDQSDDYSEDKREMERKYTEQMKRAEQAEAELAELKARRCETCDCHGACAIEEVFMAELPDKERGCILYERPGS